MPKPINHKSPVIANKTNIPDGIKNNEIYYLEENTTNTSSLSNNSQSNKLKFSIVNKVIPAVGKIEWRNHVKFPSPKYFPGTGFLIKNQYIITCAHVAKWFTNLNNSPKVKVINPSFRIIDRYRIQPIIDFLEESNIDEIPQLEFPIKKILYYNYKEIDLAILKLDGKDKLNRKGLVISDSQNFQTDTRVSGIGYPVLKMYKNETKDSETYKIRKELFSNPDKYLEFDYKAASFGKILDFKPAVGDTKINEKDYFLHDCSLIHGHSGSPIINTESGEVIGMHCGGNQERKYNYALKGIVIKNIFESLI